MFASDVCLQEEEEEDLVQLLEPVKADVGSQVAEELVKKGLARFILSEMAQDLLVVYGDLVFVEVGLGVDGLYLVVVVIGFGFMGVGPSVGHLKVHEKWWCLQE